MADPGFFVFPAGMSPAEAQALLRESYAEIDEGKLLRRTNKQLRRQGIDPPLDVQYVAEPTVVEYQDGLGISLGCDIMVYDAFPTMDACVEAFEATLNGLLLGRLAKKIRRWRPAR